MKTLTKAEKYRAQFLLHTYRRANEIGDELDPKRDYTNRYDTIAMLAAEEFMILTGEHPAGKSITKYAAA